MRLRPLAVTLAAALLLGSLGLTSPAVADGEDVLVITAADPDYGDDVVAGLQATGRFASVTINEPVTSCGGAGDPLDASTLAGIESVLLFADCDFAPMTDTIGDLLADFVDGGGTVTIAVFALYCPDNGGLGGRWASGGYDALVPDPTCAGQLDDDGPLGIVPVVADDPLLAGVTDFDGGSSSYRNVVTLATGATLVATWDDVDDTPFLARLDKGAGTVVSANFFPPSSAARDDFWNVDSDGWTVLANALAANQPEPEPSTTVPTTVPTTVTTPRSPAAAQPVVAAPTFTG